MTQWASTAVEAAPCPWGVVQVCHRHDLTLDGEASSQFAGMTSQVGVAAGRIAVLLDKRRSVKCDH